jgi:hypothetical protein
MDGQMDKACFVSFFLRNWNLFFLEISSIQKRRRRRRRTFEEI